MELSRASLQPLLEALPPKRRALNEVGYILLAVLGPAIVAALGGLGWVEAVVGGALAVWGVALLRPWQAWGEGGRKLPIASRVLLLLAAVGCMHLTGPMLLARRPVLGIGMKDDGELVEVTRVEPGYPADGRLRVGDRIRAVEGKPLSRSKPSADLHRLVRARDFAASGHATLTVRRGERDEEVTLAIPPARRAVDLPPMLIQALRALALVLLVGVLLWSDGQGSRHIGLRQDGFFNELGWSAPGLAFTYGVHFAVSIAVGMFLLLTRAWEGQLQERSEGLNAIDTLTSGVPLPLLFVALVWLAAFEEIVFRGFLLPRLRHVTGRWWAAVAISCVLFGLGHLYEGRMAVVQTAAIGAAFSGLFLWRARLEAPILTHAMFNALNLGLIMWLRSSGLLERLMPK